MDNKRKLTEEEIEERKESLERWGAEQIKKHALKPDKTPCVVYWEAKGTKAEQKEGLADEYGFVCHAYDHLNGKHVYLKEKCMGKRTQEFIDIFGENAILFYLRKASYHETSKIYIKQVDDGALMVQHLSFSARKPFKKEYGQTSHFGGYNNFVCIITQDKDIVLLRTGYKNDLCSANIVPVDMEVYNSEELASDRWQSPDLAGLRFDSAGEGAFDKTYAEMIVEEAVGNIRPYYVGSSTRIIDITFMENLKEFLCFKDLKITGSKRQKVVNALCKEIENNEIDESNFEMISKKENVADYDIWYFNRRCDRTAAYAQRLSDDTIAIRYIYSKNGIDFEGCRLFVNQDGFVGAKKDFYGNWVAVNATKDADAWAAGSFFLEKGMFDTPMKNILYYTRNQLLLDNDSDEKPESRNVTKLIYSLLRYPILESAIKVGIELGREVYCDNILDELESRTGVVSTSEKNLNKALGLNAYQVEYVINNPESEIIKDIKDIMTPFNRDDVAVRGYRYYGYGSSKEKYVSLQDMDNKTFDHMVDFVKEMSACARNCRISDSSNYYSTRSETPVKSEDVYKCEHTIKTVLRLLASFYGKDVAFSDGILNMLKMFASKHRALLEECNNRQTNSYRGSYLDYQVQPFNAYTDYLRMAVQIGDKSIAPAKLSSYEELLDAHDSLVVVMNEKKDEYEAEMLNKLKSKWAKYVMEDDNYAVIYPDGPKDIIAEGRALSHCVASFVKAVSVGATTILFLRSKNDIKKPLLTIEVQDRRVKQAHGFANCNLESMEADNPGINEFFFKWAKEKKLKADHINGMYAARIY